MEAMLVLEGIADYITFNENGDLSDVFSLSNYTSRHRFYHHIGPDKFHSLVIRSKWLVFLEITQGPFVRAENVSAPWSPSDDSPVEGIAYLETLLMNWNKVFN